MTTRRERAKEPTAKQNKQLAEMEEASKMLKIQSRKNLHAGDIYVDFAKLTFGGLVIGNVLNKDEYTYIILVVGCVLVIILLWIGNYKFNKGNQNV